MKHKVLLFSIIFFVSSVIAQVPNGGFENWTNGIPDSWMGINIAGHESITQTNFKHSGSSALSGKVVLWPNVGLYPPIIYSLNQSSLGFPISQRYNTLKGYYAFKPNGGDKLYITVTILDSSEFFIGSGEIEVDATSENYTTFQVPITYFSENTAVSCYIALGVNGPNTNEDYHEGTQMFIDDIELSMDVSSGVNDDVIINSFELKQNYPNPFNPSTIISYSVPQNAFVTLKVYNILGNEVSTLVNEQKAAGNYNVTFNASQLTTGIYFYTLQSGNFTATKKLILVK
jgi:hypothetical protein